MVKNVLFVSISLMCLFLSSCSSLNSYGVMVQVRESVSTDDLETHKEVGEVSCHNDLHFVTRNYNKTLCTDHLRNEAAILGGKFIQIVEIIELPGTFSTGVEVRAKVYAPKN